MGQDPLQGPSRGHGLCCSVAQGVKTPTSLVKIYKELVSDVAIQMRDHGQLSSWAKQGVLLLNSVLTVEQAQANAHQGKGWEEFTDRVIAVVNA